MCVCVGGWVGGGLKGQSHTSSNDQHRTQSTINQNKHWSRPAIAGRKFVVNVVVVNRCHQAVPSRVERKQRRKQQATRESMINARTADLAPDSPYHVRSIGRLRISTAVALSCDTNGYRAEKWGSADDGGTATMATRTRASAAKATARPLATRAASLREEEEEEEAEGSNTTTDQTSSGAETTKAVSESDGTTIGCEVSAAADVSPPFDPPAPPTRCVPAAAA